MKLRVRVSPRMTGRTEERDLVRLAPALLRELRTRVGANLDMRCHNGGMVSMRIATAFAEDTQLDSTTAFVAEETYDRIIDAAPLPDKFIPSYGCDPEFVLLGQQGQLIPGMEVLPFRGQLGSDGALGELRPPPGANEWEVVESLRRLIQTIPLRSARFPGTAKNATPEAHSVWRNLRLGFHIHVGAPRAILAYVAPPALLQGYIRLLQYYVGTSAMLLEENPTRRLGGGPYGGPEDRRIKGRTIEYRSASGVHLRHPDYARGIIGITAALTEDLFGRLEEQTNGWRRFYTAPWLQTLTDAYRLPKKEYIHSLVTVRSKAPALRELPQLLTNLQRLPTYKNHQDSIGRFFAHIVENRQFSPQILQNWT